MTRIQQSLLILQMMRHGKTPLVKYMVVLQLAGHLDDAGKPKPMDNQELKLRLGTAQNGMLRELEDAGYVQQVGQSEFVITPSGLEYAKRIIEGNPDGPMQPQAATYVPPALRKPDMKKVHAFLGTPAPQR